MASCSWSRRSTLDGYGYPCASYSERCHPEPIPSSSRPSLRWSSVEVIFASIGGVRNEFAATVGVRRTFLVTDAIALSVEKHSSCGICGEASGEKKWSLIETE